MSRQIYLAMLLSSCGGVVDYPFGNKVFVRYLESPKTESGGAQSFDPVPEGMGGVGEIELGGAGGSSHDCGPIEIVVPPQWCVLIRCEEEWRSVWNSSDEPNTMMVRADESVLCE